MRWKKHFTVYQNTNKSVINQDNQGKEGNSSRFQSWLPEVYTGMPNRVERYMQYDQMDTDSEINTALDTIAEFSTQVDEETGSPFKIVYKSTPSDSEAKIIERVLKQWCNLNDWDRRIFKTFRNAIKYGDQPFVRDPETWELYFVNPQDVVSVVINQSAGKDPEYYVIKNLDLNIVNQTATQPPGIDKSMNSFASPVANKFIGKQFTANTNYAGTGNIMNETSVGAEHVVHVAMTEGMDANWPFGSSILDSVFKAYKQKELLEDAMIIYRVQRAPERRVFYIDVGDMPPHKAATFLEKVKNEVHQRRIPNKTGGSQNILDAQYNPLGILEDYFFSKSGEGRGSSVEVLPGGSNLGEIDDLKYITDKLMRGLRIPSSYMTMGAEGGDASYTDGRVGTAFIQEFRFTQYCKRLQNTIQPTFDREFKRFMKHRGFNIDAGMFDIRFTEPQSFSQYRQIEIDGARANVFGQVQNTPYLSKRFILKKYLGWSESEILENERLYLEENPKKGKAPVEEQGLGDVGIRGGDFGDFSSFSEPEPFDMGGEPIGGEPPSMTSPLGGTPTAGAPAAGAAETGEV